MANRNQRRAAKAQQRKQPLPKLGALVAIPVPWPNSPSGCVEWRLVDWTVEDDSYPRFPVLDDGYGEGNEPVAWGGDYAVRDQQTGEWRFPDGERCDNEDLLATFARREAVQ